VTIDADLMDAADLLAGEQVAIVDVSKRRPAGDYVIPGERGRACSGSTAPRHLVHPGDLSS